MLYAAKDLLDSGGMDGGRVLLLFGLGEETSHTTMEAAVEIAGEIDAAVIGEPTNLDFAVAQRGLMIVDLVAQGDQRHAGNTAADGTFSNAAVALARDLLKLETLFGTRTHSLLGRAAATVTMLEAGVGRNVTPPVARAVLDVRSTPDWTHEEIAQELRAALKSDVIVTSRRMVPCETPPGTTAARPAPTGCSSAVGMPLNAVLEPASGPTPPTSTLICPRSPRHELSMPSWFGRILADTDQSSKKRIGAVSDKQRGGPEWGRPFDFSNDYYGLTLILFEFLVTGVSALSSTLAVAVMNTVPVLVKHRSSNLYFPAVFVPVPVMPTGGTPEAQGIPGANRMLVGVPLLVDVDSVIFVPFTRSVPDVAVAVREKRSVFTFMGVFTGVSAKLTLETFFNPILLQHLLLRPPTPPGDSTAAMSGLGVRRPVAERTV
jgi:hypothetical protein